MRSTRWWTRWEARRSRRTAPAWGESCERAGTPSAGCHWRVSSSAIGPGSTPSRTSSRSCSPPGCSRPPDYGANQGGADAEVNYTMDNPRPPRPLGPFLVRPIGYGAMRLAGPNVFGPPDDRREAIAILREAVDNGVDHIDTAQFYWPEGVNELLLRALYPYQTQLGIVSNVGA